jgi:hydrogenase-4 component E
MADLAHLFGGVVLALCFALLAQRRLAAMVVAFAAQSAALAGAVACQAWVQRSPALGLAALAVAGVNAAAVPVRFRRLLAAMPAGQPVRNALGIPVRLAAAAALAALAALAVLPAAALPALDRESLALALATTLLGPLMMLSWRGAAAQAIGFLATVNGLILAVAAARGMPLAATASTLLLAAGGALVVRLAARWRGGGR